MDDRQVLACRIPADGSSPDDVASSCPYCLPAVAEDIAADEWPPQRLSHLYLCCGLSTYRIAELSCLDRQHVTRTLHQASVTLRSRGLADGGHSGALTARGIWHRSSWPNSMRSPGSAHARSAC